MRIKANIQIGLVLVLVSVLFYACANRGGGPTGGPKDVTPPKVLRMVPANNTLNFKKKQITIDFDEMVSVEKASDNVVISPPQVKAADVKSYGKRITVVLNDELRDTTTYSINFGNAIVDLNEKNPVKNFIFSFATGNEIDTLTVSGTVIDARTQNPQQGILVGIYVESPDSVFYKEPFLRIGKTDEKGHFVVSNMKKGRYKIFALGDVNNDYRFQAGEGLAMFDSIIEPTFRREEMHDSIWKDSTHFDSIRTYMGTRFLPDDIVLRYFKENRKRQYFVKSERKQPFSFNLFFNTEAKQLPELKPLNFEWDGKYLLQKNATKDSLTYWITDSTVWKVDTLNFAMTYQKSDSLLNLIPVTDTIHVFERKGRINLKAKKAKTEPKAEPYKFSTNIAGTFEVYAPVQLKFEAPMDSADWSGVKLFHKVDTVFKEIKYKWHQADSTQMLYKIDYKWEPEESYDLKIDSAVFRSIYNKISNKYDGQFKIRSLDEYSSLRIFLTPFEPKAILEVLDPKDNVLATKAADTKGALIEYLKPGEYYMRLFIDRNGNGKWDPGDFGKRLQPEDVYYYPKKFTLKANWEFEETWNFSDLPLLQQKPQELLKNAAGKKNEVSNNRNM